MSRKKQVIIVLTLIVFAVSALSLYLWRNGYFYAGKVSPEKIVTQAQARLVAEKNLNLFESWKNPFLGEAFTFSDLEGRPSAYIFNVNDIYGKAGYITVSASTRFKPVTEISTSGNATPVVSSISLVNKLVANTNYEAADVKSELLYFGGNDYYVKLTFRESTDVSVRYFLLDDEEVIELPEAEIKGYHASFRNYSNVDAVLLWADFEF